MREAFASIERSNIDAAQAASNKTIRLIWVKTCRARGGPAAR